MPYELKSRPDSIASIDGSLPDTQPLQLKFERLNEVPNFDIEAGLLTAMDRDFHGLLSLSPFTTPLSTPEDSSISTQDFPPRNKRPFPPISELDEESKSFRRRVRQGGNRGVQRSEILLSAEVD